MSRSTLADANEGRDWRIYAEFAQVLIGRARKLYANEALGVELTHTVYALDATTIDLCLSMFPWAPFRTAKAAVKRHTLLDLRGAIPCFIHISDGTLHDVNGLDLLLTEPGAFYVMDRGYLDFERLHALTKPAASSSPAPNPTWMPGGCIRHRPTRRRRALRPDDRAHGFSSSQHYPDPSGASPSTMPKTSGGWCS